MWFHKVIPPLQFFIPYNGKIADITHADTSKHTLDLAAALSETRKIIAVILGAERIGGTGYLSAFPNEGTNGCRIHHDSPIKECFGLSYIIADGTQRIQYSLGVANDDFDVYCFGYVVEA